MSGAHKDKQLIRFCRSVMTHTSTSVILRKIPEWSLFHSSGSYHWSELLVSVISLTILSRVRNDKLCEDHIAPVGTFTTQIPGIPSRLCSQTPLMVFPDFQTSWRTCLLTLLSILKLSFQGALLKEHCFLVKVGEAWIKSVFRGIQLNLLWPCHKRPWWCVACFKEVSSFCSFF